MKKFLIASMGLVAAVILAASTSSAQVVAWDVAGHGSPAASLVANTSDANLASIPVLDRFDAPGSSAGNSFSSSNWNVTASSPDVNDKYFTFTVTAASGYQLNLTSLQFNMCGSNTAPNNDAWGYSTDSGATWTLEPTWHATLVSPGMQTWDFSDFTATSVEFRFWAWGTTEINGLTPSVVGGTTRIANIAGNDLILGGTVVPEPSTIALIGFGLVGMLAFGRRRFSRS